MKDRRTAPRRRVLKSGSIVLSKAPKLDCTVKNISETDAMLQVFTTLGIRRVSISSWKAPVATVTRYGGRSFSGGPVAAVGSNATPILVSVRNMRANAESRLRRDGSLWLC